jgi:hypothetical protein
MDIFTFWPRFSDRVARWQIFNTKNPDLGKFWRYLQWKLSVHFTAIWSILPPFGLFCGYLVFFPILVSCTKKNLAALFSDPLATQFRQKRQKTSLAVVKVSTLTVFIDLALDQTLVFQTFPVPNGIQIKCYYYITDRNMSQSKINFRKFNGRTRSLHIF